MENALTPHAPQVEVLPILPAGRLVRTWDGAIGYVHSSTLAEVQVEFPHLEFGRGPWTYERWQITEVA